jgi:polysaccharide export outer membrane protein
MTARLQVCVCLGALGCLLLFTRPATAQNRPPDLPPAAAPGATTGDGLQASPIAALRAFEPAADAPYELGRGDEISIDFAGRVELNAKRTIGPDGRITLPLAGSLKLADLTRDQAAEAIAQAFAPYYEHLTVTVGVDKYTSNRVLLLGAVQAPGVITFDRTPTLLEVLTKGGGLRTPVSGEFAGLSNNSGSAGAQALGRASGTVPPRLAIYRGSDQVLWVDLKGLLDNGSPLADLRLKRDDVIYVPSPLERYVSVLGQVSHPGAYLLDNNTTLPKLLAQAGGLMVQAGNNPKIQVIQPESGVTRVIPYNTMLKPSALDLTLHSGDIIVVPESGFNKVGYTLTQLSPLLSLFTTGALFARTN